MYQGKAVFKPIKRKQHEQPMKLTADAYNHRQRGKTNACDLATIGWSS